MLFNGSYKANSKLLRKGALADPPALLIRIKVGFFQGREEIARDENCGELRVPAPVVRNANSMLPAFQLLFT
jgi:hypothetical protein